MLRPTRRAISLMIVYLTAHLQVMNSLCPVGGAVYYGPDYQMCFYVVIEPATSYSAKIAACSRHGGVLSHIPDANANAFLFVALSEISPNKLVLGLNDIAEEGVYVTTAGSVQSWINWRTNQPDNCCWGEDCCEVSAKHNDLLVNDRSCVFDSATTRTLCHLDTNPELPTNYFGGQNDGTTRNVFTKLHSPSKGIVGAQLQIVLAYSQSMCALLCRQDDNCHFFISTDTLCSTYTIPKMEPTVEGAAWQTGKENVWVRR